MPLVFLFSCHYTGDVYIWKFRFRGRRAWNSRENSGFTIVELLIVVVVIAILATITIVAYNGVQARAKNSASKSSAATAAKKAELYNTEIGYYPLGMSVLTSAPASATYNLSGIVYGGSLSNDTATNAVTIYICGSGSPADITAITSSNVTGGRVIYRDYQNSVNAYIGYGVSIGTGIACFVKN